MKTLATILAVALIPLLGLSQQTIHESILHDGEERTYILYVPANYTGESEVPLVFNFHGYTSNAKQQMGYGDFRPIADTSGFIIVHPQGTLLKGKTHWNVGGWTLASKTDDVAFTAALLDSLAAEYKIDMTRVYSTGMSNGGYMSFLLACQLSDRIAAVASVTGSMTPQIFDACDPQHPTPIMQVHGTTDPVVPYKGAAWSKSIDEVLTYWISYNNCSATAETTDIADTDQTDGSTVTHTIYAGGDKTATAEHFTVTGGKHTWPGTTFNKPGTNQDFNASVEIWKFFSRYDINGKLNSKSTH